MAIHAPEIATLDDDLPRWDVASIFPALDGHEYRAARAEWADQLTALQALLDDHDVRAGRSADAADSALLAAAIDGLNRLHDQTRQLRIYVTALVSTDAANAQATAELSRLGADLAPAATLQTRLNAWVAERGGVELAPGSSVAREHESWLDRCAQAAAHQMSESEEDLLAELEVPGVDAAATLAGELTSTLEGTLHGERRPVSVLRGLAGDPDPTLRRDAYEAELAAWPQVAAPMAACLSMVSGHSLIVDRRRGWPDTLSVNLWRNRVTPEIVEAMHVATRESFPDFRRFLRAKAALHGHAGGLPWWDLVAPVPGAAAYDWSQAQEAVLDAFGSFTPRLRALAARAFQERWVDAGPRAGKRGGGFCVPVGEGASRILMNYDGSFDSVQTLAHELGHAYHNVQLATRPSLLRATPMALAETASTFCETLMIQAGLRGADDRQRLALLSNDLCGACQVVVDIHSRFGFESELYRRRGDGPLSVAELCDMMTRAQADTYGDGLDPATRHPWMWAVKPHYYFVDEHFYNWPYTFGLLFGTGLYARYRQEPETFADAYDELLSSTGMLDALPLAQRFGIDVADVGFWRSSLDVFRARIDDFVALAAAAGAPS